MKTQNKLDYHQTAAADQKRYRTFEDLEVYQIAREFRKAMYAVNRRLPPFEKFELGSQIRRAAVSLTNNIAEGHGRFHHLEQIKFCLNARGSLEELLDDLNICADETYLPAADIGRLKEQGWRVHRVLYGYMRWLLERKQGPAPTLREDPACYDWTDHELDKLLDHTIEPPAATL